MKTPSKIFTWSFHLKIDIFRCSTYFFWKIKISNFFTKTFFPIFFLVKVYQISCRLSTILRPSDLSGKNCARFSPKVTFYRAGLHFRSTPGGVWDLTLPSVFDEVYLRAQMEFGGVLWCKPTQNHPYWTMKPSRRCEDASWGNEIKKVIFSH